MAPKMNDANLGSLALTSLLGKNDIMGKILENSKTDIIQSIMSMQQFCLGIVHADNSLVIWLLELLNSIGIVSTALLGIITTSK